jgi:hypothetical protein
METLSKTWPPHVLEARFQASPEIAIRASKLLSILIINGSL